METRNVTIGTVTATRLVPLLRAAAHTHADDPDWAHVRAEAHRVTAALAADGTLPGHLVVAPDDPAVVVTRTLAVAWRLATRAPDRRLRPAS